MSGRLPWVAATVVIVIAAGLGAWALSQPTQTTTQIPPSTTPSTGAWGQAANVSISGTAGASYVTLTTTAFARTGDNIGIENVYLIKNSPAAWENNFDPGLAAYSADILATFTDNNQTQNVNYETPFKIVISGFMYAPDNMAYATTENAYGVITSTGEFTANENTLSLPERQYIFDNDNYGSTAGYIRFNIISDNAGSGWSIRAGQSVNLTELSVWGWK